jgi:hypothetical protein
MAAVKLRLGSAFGLLANACQSPALNAAGAAGTEASVQVVASLHIERGLMAVCGALAIMGGVVAGSLGAPLSGAPAPAPTYSISEKMEVCGQLTAETRALARMRDGSSSSVGRTGRAG